MTERLYYNDSFLREFDARVLSCEPYGNLWRVRLDRTAFYPTSGGQPNDLGTLGGAGVLDVLDQEDGSIAHVTSAALPLGATRGVIDWPRRFDHMQQHTGQHLLSAAFIELFRYPTVSFHLGRDTCTIDLAAEAVATAQLDDAERRGNEIVFEDRPVSVRYGTQRELAQVGVRKMVDREGLLRAIEIEGYDRQPCGGTHVARTGQIGLVLARRCEKVKGNSRVEFVCGERALRAARRDFTALVETARLLGCGPSEVPPGVARVLEERQAGHRARQRLLERLADSEAARLLATANREESPSRPRVISCVHEEGNAEYLRLLAGRLTARSPVRALLASAEDGHVVFAQTTNLDGDMATLLRDCVSRAGGKGGGTKDFAQGSVPGAQKESLERLLQDAAKRLSA